MPSRKKARCGGQTRNGETAGACHRRRADAAAAEGTAISPSSNSAAAKRHKAAGKRMLPVGQTADAHPESGLGGPVTAKRRRREEAELPAGDAGRLAAKQEVAQVVATQAAAPTEGCGLTGDQVASKEKKAKRRQHAAATRVEAAGEDIRAADAGAEARQGASVAAPSAERPEKEDRKKNRKRVRQGLPPADAPAADDENAAQLAGTNYSPYPGDPTAGGLRAARKPSKRNKFKPLAGTEAAALAAATASSPGNPRPEPGDPAPGAPHPVKNLSKRKRLAAATEKLVLNDAAPRPSTSEPAADADAARSPKRPHSANMPLKPAKPLAAAMEHSVPNGALSRLSPSEKEGSGHGGARALAQGDPGGVGRLEAGPSGATRPTGLGNAEGLLGQMRARLAGGRFRWLNEQLYTAASGDAFALMQGQPELFQQYHEVRPDKLRRG